MYESPIQITSKPIEMGIREDLDNTIYEVVWDMGVNVNRDELLKALRYDRGQYAKGYADGIRSIVLRLKARFIDVDVVDGDGNWIDEIAEEMLGGTIYE